MLYEVTVPIVVEQNGMVGPHATGLLFACDEHRFLITARHAVMDAHYADAGIFFESDCMPGRAVKIREKFFMLPDSRLDIAVLPVPEHLLPHFQDHRWARLSDFVRSPARPGSPCASCGILIDESDRWKDGEMPENVKLTPAVHFGMITERPDPVPDEWIDGVHIPGLAGLNCCSDASGAPGGPPKSLRGLSGSPVVVFTSDPFSPTFTPLPLRIIGFQSAVLTLRDADKTKIAKIVSWGAMAILISTVFPGVRDVFAAYGIRF